MNIGGVGEYSTFEIYTTSEDLDLQKTAEGTVSSDTKYEVKGESIVTIVLSK